jgi:alkanesulfonate monooxygenase SsuD/methylene tetrahydromethanopterin reductase-like flavin-dependent oxidoreductase (luciferase family)
MTVQNISKGRVILGLGAGWYREEFEAYSVEFGSLKTRLEMLEEAIQLIRLVWGADGPVTFSGKYYSVKEATLRPKTDVPPIWLGGRSKRVLAVTAEYGDGWAPFEISHEELKSKISELDGLCDGLKRSSGRPEVAYSTRIVPEASEEKAIETARALGVSPEYTSPLAQKGHMIVGSYEKCAQELGEYLDEGVSYFALTPLPVNNTKELLVTLKDKVINKL